MKTFNYDKVPLKIKFYGGFGAFGINLTTGLFLTWTQIFYIEMIKIDPLMWALAWIIYFIWNALNDPIFGHISDKTRTKYGRRIPYLMLCGPLLSISFICIYLVPTFSSNWVKFSWLLISLLIYDSFFTMVSLCFSSLLAELSINPEERAIINIFSGLGAGIAVALTYALPILFIFFNPLPLIQEIFTFQVIALILAIFGAFFLSITAFGIKERPELLPEKEQTLSLWRSIKNVLANKSFITYVIFNFTMAYVLFSVNSNLPFYLEYVLDISLENIISSTPLLFFLIFTVIGLPVGLMLTKKKGNKRALFYLSILGLTGFVLLTFANDIYLVNVSFIIIGFGFSGQSLLVFTLLGDIIDKDELETGVRREGAYFGTDALITRPAQSLAAGISGLVFFLTNFQQNLGVGESQPESAIFGIKMLLGIIPAIFITLGLISLWYYPLDPLKNEYKEIKKQVLLLHEEKLQRLKERLVKRSEN